MVFRLGTGTGGFVLLSAVILAFVLYRSNVHKFVKTMVNVNVTVA